MYVKICGTTNLEDARLAVELGAEALGFIFAPSKRRVTAEQVAAITRTLPGHVERVGVFVEPDVSAIQEAVQVAGLSAVQMHWCYDRATTATLRRALGSGVGLWQVVSFETEPDNADAAERAFAGQLRATLVDEATDVVLLDSAKQGRSGGTGQAFPWERAAALVRQEKDAAKRRMAGTGQRWPRLMLAGGLTPENVAVATRALVPDGVDVVSGVEASPGVKSPDRLRAFLVAAKGTQGL